MCNAFHHDYACPCGFGGINYRCDFSSSNHLTFYPLDKSPLESQLYKTSCPVCHEKVFFYRSPYDGRVFFDTLAPEWLKHPCTDNNSDKIFRDISLEEKFDFHRYFKTGWDIFIIDSNVKLSGDWYDDVTGFEISGKAIRKQKEIKLKVIKKNSSSIPQDEYKYNIRHLKLIVDPPVPFLLPDKITYIRQKSSRTDEPSNIVEISAFEFAPKTDKLKSHLIEARIIKIKRWQK